MKRTNTDFSKHKHRVEIYRCDNKEVRIDHFQVGDSRQDYIQFINTDSILSITGDYGNWIFCRPFIPSANGKVDDSYWIEKLKIASEQKLDDIDLDATEKEIQELIDGGLAEWGLEGERLEQAKEWYSELLDYCDDKYSFISFAYRGYEKPHFIDYEDIPCVYEIPIWLKIIFDAFDEICDRMKNNKN